ncbi:MULTISPECIES: LCP family protein [Geobacillus]|uniref:LCP family protein n=1 Tax=Geobacillus zalihae TaxID=213419 RepID=A0A1V9CRX1_9BACL|nr:MULTISPECIES: LCP family protein [Geobacillus]AGE23719.1 transcriptional regulator [Geobacillus sp. GHH01]AMQ21744.1 transcriptional regulator [Geobacillus sp. JS12]KDE46778.1 transcriptional regulator [Geobacillus sp. CAMR5420]OQP17267.1 transcriptional regulator [Geobacillus zalihae]OQP24339.1 transcriptional regulator [Geobacillus zalihae]
MNHTRKTVKKRKKKKRLRRFFLLVFLLLLGGVGAFGYNIYSEAKQASSKIYQALDPSSKPARNIEMRKDPFTVLLVGVENQYHDEEGRSDVVMLLTVNPKTNKVYLLSIPRDTRVYIPSEGRKDKITHSYSHGGIQSTIAAVNELINVPIDYYVTTDFEGFEKIVDSLGGVTVDVPFTFKAQLTGSLKWHTFHKGKQELNGNEALAYVRMRKSDPRGDFGRNERQKQVIRAIIDKSTSITSLPKLDDVIADLGDHVRTNIPPSELLSFIYVYQKMKNADVENLHLKGYDETINGVYYYIPDEQSVSSINETLRQALETSNASLTRSDSPSTQSQN